MKTLWDAALDAFLRERRRCGHMDGGVEEGRLTCECGAEIAQPLHGESKDR